MKAPPVLISVLGFFVAMVGILDIFGGLRLIGFDFFGLFKDYPTTTHLWFWGLMWIVLGVIYLAVAWALWSLRPWAWVFASIMAVFGLVSAFFVMFDAGIGAALGAALLPGIIFFYLQSDKVKSAFEVE